MSAPLAVPVATPVKQKKPIIVDIDVVCPVDDDAPKSYTLH